jgi:O-antigen ligase
MGTKNSFLKIFELVFTILSLVHLSQGLIPILITGGASEGDGVDVQSLDFSLNAKVSILIYLISFLLLVLRWKKVLNVLRKDKFIWVLLLIACLSVFWSVLPAETLRFSLYAIGTTGFGLYIASRYTLKEQLVIFSWTFILIILLSIFFIVALPKYGIMGALHEGAFRGIYTHKNRFGLMLVPASIIFFLQAIGTKKYSWVFWLLLSSSIALTVLSRSTTSIGNLAIMLFLCIVYRIFRWRYEVMITVILGVIVAGIFGLLWFINYVETDLLLVAIGKDSTFSGRTDIWRYVWDQIQLRPWLGYGLSAFWQGLKGPSGYVELAVRTSVAYAHNGFLDLWLAIGFVGLSAFILGLFNAISKSINLLRKTNSPEGFWPLLFLTYVLLSNISEGSITTMDNMFWAIYAATVFSLSILKNSKHAFSANHL